MMFGTGWLVKLGLAAAAALAALGAVFRIMSQLKKAGRDEAVAEFHAENAVRTRIANAARAAADDSFLLPPDQRTK